LKKTGLANISADTNTPGKPPVAAPAMAPTEAFEKLGLFTRKFKPNEDFKKTQAKYDKWFDTVDQKAITKLNNIPAQFRAYLHTYPLYGYYTVDVHQDLQQTSVRRRKVVSKFVVEMTYETSAAYHIGGCYRNRGIAVLP